MKVRAERPKVHECYYKEGEPTFTPSTNDYAKIAKQYEKYNSNNNVFNNKSLSDNKPLSQFYFEKCTGNAPEYKANQSVQDAIRQQNAMNGQDKVISQNMINQVYDDSAGIKVSKMPSNLTEIPRVNEKYEVKSFANANPQFKQNLRTMDLINNQVNGQNVPANLNPGFYGNFGLDKEPILKDSFEDILKRQHQWAANNKFGTMKSDLVLHSELYHPNSLHNKTTVGDAKQVQFPSELQKAQEALKIVQKGFYSKDPIEMKDNYLTQMDKGPASAMLQGVDNRLFNNNEDLNGKVFKDDNTTCKLNEELMHEIEQAQKIRQLQREGKINDQEAMAYKVEEHCPSGHRSSTRDKTTMASGMEPSSQTNRAMKQSLTTGGYQQSSYAQDEFEHQHVNPRVEYADEQQDGGRYDGSPNTLAPKIDDMSHQYIQMEEESQQPRNMFTVKMNQPQTTDDEDYQYRQSSSKKNRNNSDQQEQCRKDLPRRDNQQSPTKSVKFGEDSPLKSSHMNGSNLQDSEMPDNDYDSELNQSGYDSKYDPQLEKKIMQIKQNLQNDESQFNNNSHRPDSLQLSQSQQMNASNRESIKNLEEALQRQKERLNNFDESNNSHLQMNNPSNASPMRQSQAISSSNGLALTNGENMEDAYENLEREIREIKEKLQSSLGPADRTMSGNYSLSNTSGFNNRNPTQMSASNQNSHERQKNLPAFGMNRSQGSSANHNNLYYAQSQALKNSNSRSPDRQTANQQELEEHDYSLSVSDLNSNSFYKSGRTTQDQV